MKPLNRENMAHDVKQIIEEAYGTIHNYTVSSGKVHGAINRTIKHRGLHALLNLLDDLKDYEVFYQIRYKEPPTTVVNTCIKGENDGNEEDRQEGS